MDAVFLSRPRKRPTRNDLIIKKRTLHCGRVFNCYRTVGSKRARERERFYIPYRKESIRSRVKGMARVTCNVQLVLACLFISIISMLAATGDAASLRDLGNVRMRRQEHDILDSGDSDESSHYLADITDYYHLMGRPRLVFVRNLFNK